VTLPGSVGNTVPKSFKFKRFAQIGQPVSVCHQVSFIITFGKWLWTQWIVSGSHLSPTRQNVSTDSNLYF
jgi:hypothetical protein